MLNNNLHLLIYLPSCLYSVKPRVNRNRGGSSPTSVYDMGLISVIPRFKRGITFGDFSFRQGNDINMSDSESGNEGSSTGKRKKYDQNYKEEWQNIAQFKGWLMKSEKATTYAKCKVCNKDINIASGKDALIKHSKGKAHLTKCKSISRQPDITYFTSEASTAIVAKQKMEQRVKEGT